MLFCTVTVPALPGDQPRPAELIVPVLVLKLLLTMVLLTMLTEPPVLFSTSTAPAATTPVAPYSPMLS